MKLNRKILTISVFAAFIFLQNTSAHAAVDPEVDPVENTEQLCSDGIDNDGNTLIDLSDPECAPFVVLTEDTEQLCTDGMDNDGNTLIDLSDPGCAAFIILTEDTEQLCSDGIDNDGNTMVDFSDPGCAPFVIATEDTEELCTDGIDNDGNTLVDFSDPGCAPFVIATEDTEELCTDGIDNDGNTMVDLSDPGCAPFVELVENTAELCSDGIDNDGNTMIDLSDPGCAAFVDDGGNGDSGTSSGGSSRRTRTVPTGNLSSGQVLGTDAEFGSCKVFTTFMKFGANNDVEEVKMLQTFLNSKMNAGLPVTGYFGPLTLQAVKNFQAKYADQILQPWVDAGLMASPTPTGHVYKTTQYVINTMLCDEAKITYPVLN
jgi:hypothetical protein